MALRGTGLALCGAGGLLGCWDAADAVLYCGPGPCPPLPPREHGWPSDGTGAGGSAGSGHNDTTCSGSGSVGGGGSGASSDLEGRLLQLAVLSAKDDRRSLASQLHAALRFVSAHVAAGRRVVIADDSGECWARRTGLSWMSLIYRIIIIIIHRTGLLDEPWRPRTGTVATVEAPGVTQRVRRAPALPCCSELFLALTALFPHAPAGLDACVCVAVAALLACFGAPGGEAGGGGPASPAWAQPYEAEARGVDAVSKEAVRQRLAFVSGCYSGGRPTRGMLRQVYNFFQEQQRGAAAG